MEDENMRIKKLLAVGLAVALVFSMSACSMGNKTTYLTLTDEMSALKSTESKGSVSVDMGDMEGNTTEIDEITLDLEGKSVKDDGLDYKFKLDAGEFDMEGDLIVKGENAYVSVDTAFSLIGSVLQLMTGASDSEVEAAIKEMKKEIDAEYIEAPLEMSGTDLSKVNFSATIKALDALTKAYKSTILSGENGVYKMTITKDTIKSEVEAIKVACKKSPKKMLPLIADFLEAFANDGLAFDEDEDGKLEDIKDTAKEIREAASDKEALKEFKESLEKDDNFLSEMTEGLDEIEKLNIVSSIEKKDGAYHTVLDFEMGKKDEGSLKFKYDFTIKGIEGAEIKAPDDVIDADELGLGFGGTSSKKDKDDEDEKPVTRPSDDEDEDEEPAKKPVEDDDEDEEPAKKPEKEPAKKTSNSKVDLVDDISKSLSKSEVQGIVDSLCDSLDGSWKDSSDYSSDGTYSYSRSFDEDDWRSEIRLANNTEDAYSSFELTIHFDDPGAKTSASAFKEYVKEIFGKNILTSDVEDAIEKASSKKNTDSYISVEVDGEEVDISIKYEEDEEYPEWSGGWYSIDLFISWD